MALTFKLTDGSTDIDLVYNSSSQPNYAMQYGARMQAQETDILEHVPDYGEAKPVRGQDRNRVMYLTMHVLTDDSSPDTILNKLAELERWVDGADQQALRYHTDGDCDKILLQVAVDGATNTTNHSVLWGFVDDSAAWFHDYKKAGDEFARNVVVMLTLEPYGEAASTIALSNDMFSSPHFVEDSNADGLADGWTSLGANTTYAIDTDQWLIGGQSQRIECTNDAEAQGILCDTVTAAAADEVVAYIWITGTVAADVVYIQLRDGASTLVTEVEFDPASPAGYDKIITEPPGGTKIWYRYVVGDDGTGPRGAANVSVWVTRKLGDASAGSSWYRIDGAYIEVDGSNGTTAPDAWMSARNIDNRIDIRATSQATENYLNYIDIWGVLGDAEPLVDMYLDLGTAGTSYTVMSQVYDGEYLATEKPSHIEAEDLATKDITDGAFATPGDAARSAADYIRFTASATYGSGTFYHTLTGANAPAFTSSALRVIAICRSDDTSATIRMTTGNILVPENAAMSEARSVQTASTWEAIDLGSIDATHTYDKDVTYASGFTVNFIIENVTDTKVFECDVVHYMPVDDGFSYMPVGTAGVQPDVVIYGTKKKVTSTLNPGVRPHGTIWTCAAGNTTSRRYVVVFETDGAHDLTDATPVTLTITPRTRHLIGTA